MIVDAGLIRPVIFEMKQGNQPLEYPRSLQSFIKNPQVSNGIFYSRLLPTVAVHVGMDLKPNGKNFHCEIFSSFNGPIILIALMKRESSVPVVRPFE